MNEFEIRDLSRLSNQLFYEIAEFGRPITPDLCISLYTLICQISLPLLGSLELKNRDDGMLRLLIVKQTLCLLARDIPQHSQELLTVANEVDRIRTEYGGYAVNG